MKKTLLVILLNLLLFSFNLMAQNTGIGTATPGNTLHVFKGSAGGGTGYVNSPLIVENSTHNYINVLAPFDKETGILFGNQFSNVDGGIIYNGNGNPYGLQFRTNLNITRMVLTSAGDLGVGTIAPESRLHIFNGSAGTVTGWSQAPLIVEGSTDNYINILAPDAAATGILFGKPASNISGGIVYNNISGTNPNGFDFRTNGNTTQMVLTELGRLGLGVNPEGYKLKVSIANNSLGFDIENSSTQDDWEIYTLSDLSLYFNTAFRGAFNRTTGIYTPVSDERLKTNIKPMTPMLEKISQLKPSTYQFKNTADKQEYNGFIAQDVMKLFPSLVVHNVNPERKLDVYTMDYSGFGVIAIKAIQELQPIIEEQKKKIATLEERITKLEAILASKL